MEEELYSDKETEEEEIEVEICMCSECKGEFVKLPFEEPERCPLCFLPFDGQGK